MNIEILYPDGESEIAKVITLEPISGIDQGGEIELTIELVCGKVIFMKLSLADLNKLYFERLEDEVPF